MSIYKFDFYNNLTIIYEYKIFIQGDCLWATKKDIIK